MIYNNGQIKYVLSNIQKGKVYTVSFNIDGEYAFNFIAKKDFNNVKVWSNRQQAGTYSFQFTSPCDGQLVIANATALSWGTMSLTMEEE